MFGSALLDVAIGMIFVYLLLSLICSAANEIIEGWLKNRATDLERGIRELLAPNSAVDLTGIVGQLYDHPLINGLFKGTYQQFVDYKSHNALWRWLVRLFSGPDLPSYVPARNFAIALMDTVLPGSSAETPVPPPQPGVPPPPAPANIASGAAGATPPAASAAPLVVVNPAAPAVPAPGAPNPLQPLRDAVGALPYEQTRKALLALVDAAGGDVNKARENIETWFNSSMDRVSGWYKRRSQLIIFVLGLIVAFALNADSVALVKSLSTDKTLRDSLVAAAEAYARNNPAPPAAPGQAANTSTGAAAVGTTKPAPSPSPSPSPSPKATPSPSPSPSPAASPMSSPSPTSSPLKAAATPSPSPATSPTPPECANGNENSPECKIAKNEQEIKSLGLPLGWLNSGDDLHRKWPGNQWSGDGGWWDQLSWHLLGWLITALAVSLGAPFWFDLLNKFIVVRSTVKPHEKSPEEPSKQ